MQANTHIYTHKQNATHTYVHQIVHSHTQTNHHLNAPNFLLILGRKLYWQVCAPLYVHTNTTKAFNTDNSVSSCVHSNTTKAFNTDNSVARSTPTVFKAWTTEHKITHLVLRSIERIHTQHRPCLPIHPCLYAHTTPIQHPPRYSICLSLLSRTTHLAFTHPSLFSYDSPSIHSFFSTVLAQLA